MNGDLSSLEVCQLLGVSYRQLDYWIRTGLIPGAHGRGSGTQRSFDAEAVEFVRRVRDTRDGYLSDLEQIRDEVRQIERRKVLVGAVA
jgi:DNA-binding transcriptional MerR regulator